MISIQHLNKAAVLAALYNNSKQQGMGFIHTRGRQSMTIEEAQLELNENSYFDYLHGRVMKVDLSGNEFEERLYDRDNGDGAAFNAIKDLK